MTGRIFKELSMPGTLVGDLKPEIQKEVGFNLKNDGEAAVIRNFTNEQPVALPNTKDTMWPMKETRST